MSYQHAFGLLVTIKQSCQPATALKSVDGLGCL